MIFLIVFGGLILARIAYAGILMLNAFLADKIEENLGYLLDIPKMGSNSMCFHCSTLSSNSF